MKISRLSIYLFEQTFLEVYCKVDCNFIILIFLLIFVLRNYVKVRSYPQQDHSKKCQKIKVFMTLVGPNEEKQPSCEDNH